MKMLTEEIKNELKSIAYEAIRSGVDGLRELQDFGWEISLEDTAKDLLDLQSSFSLRDSLLEEALEMRKRGEEIAIEEGIAYMEEVLSEIEVLPLWSWLVPPHCDLYGDFNSDGY